MIIIKWLVKIILIQTQSESVHHEIPLSATQCESIK